VGVDAITRADARVPVDNGVRTYDRTGANAHAIRDDRIGPYPHIVGEIGTAGDNGRGMVSIGTHWRGRRIMVFDTSQAIS
jgi:hypothetical protein